MSKLLHSDISSEKVVIGEFRSDIARDQEVEERLGSIFVNIAVLTTIEGKKLVPIQELLKIEQQLLSEKNEAYDKGYKEGYDKGVQRGHLEAEEVVNNFASLLKDASNQRDILFQEAHRQILELVLKIATKVTFEAVKLDPNITATVISGTIQKLVNKSKIKVMVNPDQLPIIEQQIEKFKGTSSAIKELSIEPDSRVRYGGCFIETPTGDIDARIDSQLDIIHKAILINEDEE